MKSWPRLFRPLRSARTWIGLGILAPVGMVVVSALMLLDLRQDAWDKAEQTARNLLQVIERDIARNGEIFDLSLRAVVDNLKAPGVTEASPELRQLILFDWAASAKDMGVMLVLDEHGNIAIDAGSVTPRKVNYADREYFKVHKAKADLGLYVGTTLVSRLIPFSRRISKPDGSFGGVVLGTLKLSYFTSLFERLGLGPGGAINLYHLDGTRILRQPYIDSDIGANIANTSNFQRFVREGKGSFVAVAVRDGVERHYAFTRIGDLPLILNVALATADIEAEWRAKALVIGGVVLILCGLTIGLSLLFGRELERRAAVEAELAQLSMTDSLTSLPNRRRFDEALATSWKIARRTGTPLSLLIVDADHFKRYNDHYGHAVGDEVLQGLARCLSASVHRPGDLVARVGGEEFALLLPGTDRSGALKVADRVHAEVAKLPIESVAVASGSVTVRIGLASVSSVESETATATGLFERADAALYEAKASGRNRTCCDEPTARRPAALRMVGAA